MRHSGFDRIAVEVIENGDWLYRKYFDTINEALRFKGSIKTKTLEFRFLTADKYGNVIEEI